MGERSLPGARKPRPPLDATHLRDLAFHYVGRYATTRAKLALYLRRKVRERGWAGDDAPPIEAVIDRCVELGFVDDAAFARARGEALSRRGFGARRVSADLRAAGIADDQRAAVADDARAIARDSALRFARRKRIGPFATVPMDRDACRRALAAMLRAGHDMALARRIVEAEPGSEIAED
jgi:regulatory protein